MNQIINRFNRAIMCHQRGDLEEAVELYLQVLPHQRDNFDLVFTIGTAYCQLGRLEEGFYYLRKASRLNPKNFHIYGNLGTVLAELKRYDEAVMNYNKSISLNPRFVEAFFGRANAFAALNNLAAALADYNSCIDLAPNFAIAYNNRGQLLVQMNRLAEAIDSYRSAIKFNPNFAEAYCNLGSALVALGQLDEAIECYYKSNHINPRLYGGFLDLAKTLYEIGRKSDADLVVDEALLQNPESLEVRWFRAIAHLPLVSMDQQTVQSSRQAFDLRLAEINQFVSTTHVDLKFKVIGSAQPFYLAYHEADNSALLSKYGKLSCAFMKDFQYAMGCRVAEEADVNRIKVGIVSNHIHRHSVWDAFVRGWVSKLNRDRFDLYFYYTGSVIDGETMYARSNSKEFREIGSNLANAVESILNDGLDVLVYPEIGMDPMTVKLASMRLAPVQIASWGHPETTGLPTIDHFLSAELFETDQSDGFYTENLVNLPNLGCYYEKLEVTPCPIELDELGIDANLPLLICPGSPFKYQPEFDYVFVEIAKRLGACTFVFFIYPTTQLTDLLRSRLYREFEKHELTPSHFMSFVPWLPKESFYSLLNKADVYLDTIGFSGFNTALQALECNLPVVTREGRFMRGRLASGVLTRIRLYELIAKDEINYIELATKLVSDREFNQQIRQVIRENLHQVYEDMEPIRSLESFIEGVTLKPA